MERLLQSLFDYQRFARNEHLDRIITDTESRYLLEKHLLQDDMLELNAAGDTAAQSAKRQDDE